MPQQSTLQGNSPSSGILAAIPAGDLKMRSDRRTHDYRDCAEQT